MDEKEDQQRSEIHTNLDPSINITEPNDFSSTSNEVTPSSSVSQSIITENTYVETTSTLSVQRGQHLGNLSQLPVRILYERLGENGTSDSNSAILFLSKNGKKTMMDENGDGSNKKRVMSTSAEAGGPMTLYVRDKKTKEEQGSVGGTLDVDSEPVTVMQEAAAAARRHSVVVPLLKAKAANDMEVNGSGATITADEEGKGGDIRRNISTIDIDTVVDGGLPSLSKDNVDNGDNRFLFYALLALTVAFAGIGMTISVIVAAVFIIKFKYGRRNARNPSACCKVHFTKTDNNNSCNVAVNADCTNVNNVFQGVVSPDLLQHQGTLSKGLTFSTVPELVDFSVKFSSNVCEKSSSGENIYDEIRSCKEDPTFSSFYVNFNSSSNTCS
ncbi:uncharacterized protein LOC108739673 [Agrilus planipennis]|uniref:Uncharacterized protein LOC108739673 n=1 Tax=Agrilus planipennis TaxID=224129 RepID=A0A7F5RGW3_AGRPL|nr:uncharacterized protein LOC108739673 [Agrilus planipennis]